jgi:hypothetical protein
MIDSYWDLYVAYVDKCVRDNRNDDIDPHHYDVEWNHLLPRCIFGDWPIGQYLTLKQHAIASALQTLALQKNCMFGWHKEYLPVFLIDLAWPHFVKQCADNGRSSNEAMNGHPNTAASRRSNLSTGVCSENGKKTGPLNVRVLNDHPNAVANRIANSEKSSKRVILTDTTTGQNLEFPSLREACRSLGLNRGHLGSVARGSRKQHKGYTAVYL